MNADLEKRVERTQELFKEGYNCCQSVVLAFADLFGVSQEMAAKISAPFGGGMGRMNLTCGAVSAMVILEGMMEGNTDPKNADKKSENYARVQELAKEFKKIHSTLICGEMLGITPRRDENGNVLPALPKKPCIQTVADAGRIFAEFYSKYHQS